MDDIPLTYCDLEPIHLSARILPHGAMVVCDETSLVVLQAAGDTDRLLGCPADSLLGKTVDTFLGDRQVAWVRQVAGRPGLSKPRHAPDPALRAAQGIPADASVHRTEGMLVIEWEPAGPPDAHSADPLAKVREMTGATEASASTREFCQAAAATVRAVTGYDRVLVYTFLEDESGWVIAEARGGRLPSLLNLRFPASDIPRQARALYARNLMRSVPRVDDAPAPLLPPVNPRTGRPLDMSFAVLRDVSPLHRMYLRNMRVAASMSVSILRGGRLWGLIACHHHEPLYLPRRIRGICELFGSVFSMQLEVRERTEALNARLVSRDTLKALMRALTKDRDHARALLRHPRELLDCVRGGGISIRLTDTAGAAVRVAGGGSVFGATPPEALLDALTDWLRTRMPDSGVFATHRLGDLWPPARDHAGTAAGLLAVSVSQGGRDFILWFRPEVPRAIDWAGNPAKPVQAGPDGAYVLPRQSFEPWHETLLGCSSPWAEEDIGAAADLRVAVLDLMRRRDEVAGRLMAQARQQENNVVADIEDVARNTLSAIEALVAESGRDGQPLRDYVTGLEHRIRSMAHSHGLVTRSKWKGVSLRDLLREELGARCDDGGPVGLDGPDVVLVPKVALPLAIAVHELADNAVRYGSLSAASGRVAVSWALGPTGTVDLHWAESAGPAVGPSPRRGFGARIIEQALPMETGARAALRFAAEGVSCDIVLPASAVVAE